MANATNLTAHITHYAVTNRITGNTTTYKSGTVATKAADRMNMAYGSHIAGRRAVWSDAA